MGFFFNVARLQDVGFFAPVARLWNMGFFSGLTTSNLRNYFYKYKLKLWYRVMMARIEEQYLLFYFSNLLSYSLVEFAFICDYFVRMNYGCVAFLSIVPPNFRKGTGS